MSFVVDASVALKWVIDEPDAPLARELFDIADELYAPDIVLVEVGNALWKKTLRQEITKEQSQESLGKVESYFDELISTRPLLSRALTLAVEISHPIYDCLYLAFAERLEMPLVTSDHRLYEKAKALPSVKVQTLSATPPASS